jgi:hypothetical protein
MVWGGIAGQPRYLPPAGFSSTISTDHGREPWVEKGCRQKRRLK